MKSRSISSILRRLILVISIAIFFGLMFIIFVSEYHQYQKDFQYEKKLIEDEKKIFLKAAVKNVISYVEYAHITSEKNMKSKLINAVNNAINQAQNIYNLNRNDRSEPEIKKIVISTLRELRYFNGRGYIYIIDMTGKLQMYPFQSSIEGTNSLGISESIGRKMINEQLNIIQDKNEAFYTYKWPKPWTNDSTIFLKTSFIKRFEPFNWIIGCGEYYDEHQIETKEEAINYLKNSYSADDWNLFINQYDGTSIIINSSKYKAGVNIKDISDNNGLKVFEEELRIARSDSSEFLYYNWPIDEDKFIPKMAYISGFHQWEWMIGASSSLQKLDHLELQKTKSFYQFSWIRILLILLIAGPFVMIILNQLQKTGIHIKDEINLFFKQIEAAVKGNKTKSPQFKIDEFTHLSKKVNQLLSNHLTNITALKESEEKFRILVEHAPLAIIGIDNKGLVKIWNKQSEKFYDIKKDKVLDRLAPIDVLFDGKIKQNAKNGMFDNNPEFKLIPIKLKNGKSAFQYWASFRISDNLLIWVGNDVTDLKETEHKLLESRNFMDTLLESIPSPIFYKNINGAYIGGNSAFFNLIDKTPEEIIGKGVYDLYPLDLAEVYHQKDVEVFEGNNQQYDFIFRRDDITRNFTYYKAPFKNTFGKIDGLIGVMLDITDRIKFEEELKSNQKELKALNSTKDKFFSIIAHDLLNPFNVMINSGEMLAESVNDKDFEGANEMIDLLNPAIKNAYTLLLNLLEWSRSQSGTIQFSPKKTAIDTEIQSSLDLTAGMAQSKNIELVKNISFTPKVSIDKNMFKTIMRNLLSNAIKFTPNGGKIIVETQNLYEFLMISITDNGIGMDKKSIDNLFKIDKTNTRKGTNEEPGTGLGLLLVDDFVKRHNGKINVKSEIHKGTTISIWLPLS